MDLILQKYSLKYNKIYPPQKGYRNRSYIIRLEDDCLVNLIIYKKEEGILNKIITANLTSKYFHENNLPVRYSIAKILKLKENYYACLYNYLPGKTIPWEAYTMQHLKLLGEYMNKIHLLGLKYTNLKDLPSESENLIQIVERMQKYFAQQNINEAIERKLNIKLNLLEYLNKANQIINKVDQKNPKTVLHMDFVRGNILFQENPEAKISGIIDFEKASYGSPLFDIARTLAFLIIDCKYKEEKNIRKYFLRSGYIKRGELKLNSFKYLNQLIIVYLIYDFYKFLKHNPYEFLQQNEHFIRTRNILLKNGMLVEFKYE